MSPFATVSFRPQISQGHRLLISTTAPLAAPVQEHHRHMRSTARALVHEPRRAVLGAIHRWAAEQAIDSADLAALNRVLVVLAEAEQGPDLDHVMRTARRQVIAQARRRQRHPASG